MSENELLKVIQILVDALVEYANDDEISDMGGAGTRSHPFESIRVAIEAAEKVGIKPTN